MIIDQRVAVNLFQFDFSCVKFNLSYMTFDN